MDLDAVAARLNARPRKTLGWPTPAERLRQLVPQHADSARESAVPA